MPEFVTSGRTSGKNLGTFLIAFKGSPVYKQNIWKDVKAVHLIGIQL